MSRATSSWFRRTPEAARQRSGPAYRAAITALALIAALAGCVKQPAMTFVPAPVSCRSLAADPLDGGAVRWIGPGHPRDRKKLDAWCATVGPVVVDGPSAPTARTSERWERSITCSCASMGAG